jgi:hypothetical protein
VVDHHVVCHDDVDDRHQPHGVAHDIHACFVVGGVGGGGKAHDTTLNWPGIIIPA